MGSLNLGFGQSSFACTRPPPSSSSSVDQQHRVGGVKAAADRVCAPPRSLWLGHCSHTLLTYCHLLTLLTYCHLLTQPYSGSCSMKSVALLQHKYCSSVPICGLHATCLLATVVNCTPALTHCAVEFSQPLRENSRCIYWLASKWYQGERTPIQVSPFFTSVDVLLAPYYLLVICTFQDTKVPFFSYSLM